MTPNRVRERLRPPVAVLLRVVVVTLTLYPALRKFFEYSSRVEQFYTYGMPWPEVAVPVTGIIEVGAIVLIGAGIAGRLGAGALVVGMIVAIVAAGPNPFSLLVLAGSVGILLVGTGPYSYWDPTIGDLLTQLTSRTPIGGASSTEKQV